MAGAMHGDSSANPALLKAMTAKHLILRKVQIQFRSACDQIVLLNKRMEGVLFRYNAARDSANRSFRYKLRLRLAVVEGIRNMFYEYANIKAVQIVNLRRDLFGEIVEIVNDENAVGRYYGADDNSEEDDSFSESEAADDDEDLTEDDEGMSENSEDILDDDENLSEIDGSNLVNNNPDTEEMEIA
ncbi:hypothetical protein DPMN_136035 [Dreissena polymorpha]|uniref:Uncharacterized protein n=1 Tax=Dreissena polymorpha TaxID=45954 RepID=A0A9D4G2W5_DREPO|nr:hypothetical protein DPMN_136035 [Dreissena polymorpha]